MCLAILALGAHPDWPLVIAANPHNEAYLRTKALRDGHSF